MTREQAIGKLVSATARNADPIKPDGAAQLIQALEALDLIKIEPEEPRPIKHLLADVLAGCAVQTREGWQNLTARSAVDLADFLLFKFEIRRKP